MKAMAIDEFGGSDKLTLHTLPVPSVETTAGRSLSMGTT